MTPNKPENQPAQIQIVTVKEEELDENELEAINGGLSGTSLKGKQPKTVVIAIIAILIG